MRRYSTEPRTRKYVKDMDFHHLLENMKSNDWTQDNII